MTQPISNSTLNPPELADEIIKITEFDFDTESKERIERVNVLWADGFRIIVPMYWKEIIFSFQQLPLILLGSLTLATIIVYFFFNQSYNINYTDAPTWYWALVWFFHANLVPVTIAFALIAPIYPAFDFFYRSYRVEQFINMNGVKPANVTYDKFYICELDSQIVSCVGVKCGKSLEDNPPGASTSPEETDAPRVMSVWRLTVDEKFRKFGLGRKMMKVCEDYAIEQGYDCIRLLAGNIDSIRFYERLNYEVDSVAWSSGRHVSLYFKKYLTNVKDNSSNTQITSNNPNPNLINSNSSETSSVEDKNGKRKSD